MSDNNYVTRDFYDSNMREFREAVNASMIAAEARCERIAADMRAQAAEMRAEGEKMRADFKTQSAELRTQYKITQQRLDNIERLLDNFFKMTGFALAGMTLLLTATQVIIALIK